MAFSLHSEDGMETANRAQDARRRHWADLLAIVAGVWTFGQALWGPTVFSSAAIDRGVGPNWLAFGIGGLVALGSVFLAQRYTRPARIILGLAGLSLLLV